jgi:hypothetical protein
MWDLGSAALFYPPFSASAEFAGFRAEQNVRAIFALTQYTNNHKLHSP